MAAVQRKKRIIFLIGPTASGKTFLAIKLAKRINADIVSCDSMQVYRGLDILSSKPSKALQRKVSHHLLDIVPPDKEFSVVSYRRAALRAIKDIHNRHKIPLFVGGSGLYMSIVIDGIFRGVKNNKALRDKLNRLGMFRGSIYLHKRLRRLDPEAALKIHPNDLKRIIRALEVYQLTGKPISELKKQRRGLSSKYDIIIFGLDKARQDLYRDINRRVDYMFDQGLVKEVEVLLKKRLSRTCRQAIGIKEISGYLEGRYGLEEAKELIKRNTRRYAKKQLTWFRKDKRIIWLDIAGRKIINRLLERMRE